MLFKIGYSEMIYVESYGENFFKSYNISENKTFRYVNANGIFSMNQINIRGIFDCDGIVEEVDNSASLNMVCKLTDESKKVSYAKFERRDSESLVTVFNFLSGEGVIGLLKGEKCLGASHRFNVETLPSGHTKNKSYFKGKCNISEVKYKELLNYK
tara:strand:- start:54 stop:521 length:468 start_codon:yes stop_codon:yes gene_type:complete